MSLAPKYLLQTEAAFRPWEPQQGQLCVRRWAMLPVLVLAEVSVGIKGVLWR